MSSSIPSKPINAQSPARSGPSGASTVKPRQDSRAKSILNFPLTTQYSGKEPYKPPQESRPKPTVQSHLAPQYLGKETQTAKVKAKPSETGSLQQPPKITPDSIAAVIRLRGQLGNLESVMQMWTEVEAARIVPKTLEILKDDYWEEVQMAVNDVQNSLCDVQELMYEAQDMEEGCSVEKRADDLMQSLYEYVKHQRLMIKRCKAVTEDQKVKETGQRKGDSRESAYEEIDKGVKNKKKRKDPASYLSDADMRGLRDKFFEAVRDGMTQGNREREDKEINDMKKKCFQTMKHPLRDGPRVDSKYSS